MINLLYRVLMEATNLTDQHNFLVCLTMLVASHLAEVFSLSILHSTSILKLPILLVSSTCRRLNFWSFRSGMARCIPCGVVRSDIRKPLSAIIPSPALQKSSSSDFIVNCLSLMLPVYKSHTNVIILDGLILKTAFHVICDL